MTTIAAIDKYISSFATTELREGWDNDGIMLCRDTDIEVKKAVLCLEMGYEAAEYASKVGAQLIITHHPYIFNPVRSIVGEKCRELEILIKNDISVLSYHTRYDKAVDGVNDVLARVLGLENITDNGSFLRCGELSEGMSGDDFARLLRERLGCGVMKTYFEKDAVIKRVAVCGGAGKGFAGEAAKIADAYVSADFSHETFLDAKRLGIAVFDAGHYHTENPAVKALCERLKSEFSSVDFDFYDVGCPFFTV